MLILFALLWWSLVVGVFNTYLRKRGYSYGGTPVQSALFYSISTICTLVIFAPISLEWQILDRAYAGIFVVLLGIIASLDWYIATKYQKDDRTRVRNSTLVKYTDILFQQLMIFIIYTSIAPFAENSFTHLTFFACIFAVLHLPVFFVMPRPIAWTFLLASLGGGCLFPALFILNPTVGPYTAMLIHILFYSILRAGKHDSDTWAHFTTKD